MNETAKRKLLRHVPYGLYVIGVGTGPSAGAFTGSWLTQVSMTPPVIAVGVRGDSASLKLARKKRVLSVNFIDKRRQQTLRHFAKSTRNEHKRLDSVAHAPGTTGAPVLNDAIGYLECRIRRIVDGFGDHALIIAEVVEAEVRNDALPLVMTDTPWHYAG